MTIQSVNDFSVVLTGASNTTRMAAALLIDQTLRNHGFNLIDVLDKHGEPVTLPDHIPSVLDVIRRESPTFFQSSVTIQEVKVKTYDYLFGEENARYVME